MSPATLEQIKIALLGVAGGFAVEVWNIHLAFEAGRQLPVRYRKPWFWVNRVLLSLLGGLLAWGYGITSPILAFHVGASAPAIIGSFAKSPPGNRQS